MNRIKVVNEPSDLVPILRAVDTETKRKVFQEVSTDWRTATEIEEKFGEEGKEALVFFEKMKLVETKWQSSDSGAEKAYHTYYKSFHINTSTPVMDISDVLAAAMMPEKEFKKLEDRLVKIIGNDGVFVGDATKDLDLSQMMLKSLVKRSTRLEYRGHRIELITE